MEKESNTGNWNTGNWNTGNSNEGNWNAGDWNAGHWNAGHRNTGDRNTGNWNAGDWNTGHWNTGDWNAGCFNTTTPETANYFNTPAKVSDWDAADKPGWLYMPSPTTWVDKDEMTDAEKTANPSFETCGGYLRENEMNKEWEKAYATASLEDIQKVRALPNFDADVFMEITGLDLRIDRPETCSGKIVEIDGKKYRLEELK